MELHKPASDLDAREELLSYCPLCKEQSLHPVVRQIAVRAEAELVHVVCSMCHVSVVSLVINDEFGLSSMGLITDLSAEEVETFPAYSPVQADDVLQAYEFFEGEEWKQLLKPVVR